MRRAATARRELHGVGDLVDGDPVQSSSRSTSSSPRRVADVRRDEAAARGGRSASSSDELVLARARGGDRGRPAPPTSAASDAPGRAAQRRRRAARRAAPSSSSDRVEHRAHAGEVRARPLRRGRRPRARGSGAARPQAGVGDDRAARRRRPARRGRRAAALGAPAPATAAATRAASAQSIIGDPPADAGTVAQLRERRPRARRDDGRVRLEVQRRGERVVERRERDERRRSRAR